MRCERGIKTYESRRPIPPLLTCLSQLYDVPYNHPTAWLGTAIGHRAPSYPWVCRAKSDVIVSPNMDI